MRHIWMIAVAVTALLAQACASNHLMAPTYKPPTTHPDPMQPIDELANVSTTVSKDLHNQASEVAAAADAIDDAAPPGVKEKLEPHTRRARHAAGEIASQANRLRDWFSTKLTQARDYAVQLAEQRDTAIKAAKQFQSYAAAEHARAEKERERADGWLDFILQVGAALCWAAAAACLITGLLVFHSIRFAGIGFAAFTFAGGLLGAYSRWSGLIILGSLAIAVAIVTGIAIYGYRKGWFTDSKVVGAAKLFIEGKPEEGVAALRQLPAIAEAWNHAKRKTPPKQKEAA